MTRSSAMLCVLILGLSSCAAPRAGPDVAAAVHHLVLPWAGASATTVGPLMLLATRHQLRGNSLEVTFEIEGQTYRAVPIINGRPRDLRLVASGDPDVITDDWILLEGADVPPSPYLYDPHRDIRPGTPLLLAGFPARLIGRDGNDSLIAAPIVLRGRVIAEHHMPKVSLVDDWQWGSGRKLICRLSWRVAPLGGMSGGAAFAWDEDRSAWIVVGIVHGSLQEIDDQTGEMLNQGRHVIVIRPNIADRIASLHENDCAAVAIDQ